MYQQGDKVKVKCIGAPYNTGVIIGVRYFKTMLEQYYVQCDDRTGLGWYLAEQLVPEPTTVKTIKLELTLDEAETIHTMVGEYMRLSGVAGGRYSAVADKLNSLLDEAWKVNL